jgi:putative lysine transport system substrate-binding protein
MTACGGKSDSEGGVLKVGMECNYAPFNWTQAEDSDGAVALEGGGYAAGYDVEIAKIVAEGLGKELQIVKTEWDGLPPALQSGKIDAIIAGMSPTAERKATFDFSDPYYQSELVVVVKKDSPFASATSLADLSGAKITGQLNTFHYSVIDQIPGVEKQTALETFPAMIVSLQSGRIDGYVSEKPGAVSAQASNPDITFVEFPEGSGFEASLEDTAIAVGVNKDNKELPKINEILKGISQEKREQLMNDAVANQPLSEEE